MYILLERKRVGAICSKNWDYKEDKEEKMQKANRYAPILHTGFGTEYDKEVIAGFMEYCREHGYSGVSLEGKSDRGLLTDNDIEEWIQSYMDKVRILGGFAEEKGLDVWLFDEWGYPSGTAAGRTIAENPDFRSKELRITADVILNADEEFEIQADGRFIAASVWDTGRFGAQGSIGAARPLLLGRNAGTGNPDCTRLTYRAARDGERVVCVGFDYNSSATHGIFADDMYKTEYGTIDLLSREAVECFINNMHERCYAEFSELFGTAITGFFYDEPYLSYPFPYTEGILEEFKKRFSYDIAPYLPGLLAAKWYTQEERKHIANYRALVTDKMAENFTGRIQKWCAAHRVLLAGHQDLDHAVRGLNTRSGDFFKNSENSDSPGVDYIWNQIKKDVFCDYPRLAGSVKHLCSKEHAASESFAVTGYGKPIDDMRWVMEHQIIRGIDLFFLMIARPDPAEQKEYTNLSINHPQNVRFGKLLNSRIAEVNRLACEGIPAASCAVYVPTEDIFIANLQQGHPWSVSLQPSVWERVERIAEALRADMHDYEYIWDGAIETLEIKDKAFVTERGQRIETVILTGGICLPEKTKKRLEEFLDDGGNVIVVGSIIEGLSDRLSYSKAQRKAWLARDGKAASKALAESAFLSDGKITMTVRRTQEGTRYFLLNESSEAAWAKGMGRYAEYNFDSGRFDIAAEGKLAFEAGELRILSEDISAAKRPSFDRIKDGKGTIIDNWGLWMPGDKKNGEAVFFGNGVEDLRGRFGDSYTGSAVMEAELEIGRTGEYCLDFSGVRYAAEVTVDGRKYKLPFSPYRLTLPLKKGRRRIVLEIFNTRANELLGTPAAEIENVKKGRLRSGMYEQDRFYLEWGLTKEAYCYFVRETEENSEE